MHGNGVDGHVVDGSWMRDGLVLGEVGHAVVLDIGHVTAGAVGIDSVGDNLGAAVRESHPVIASHNFGV